jgi:hypothetical protein
MSNRAGANEEQARQNVRNPQAGNKNQTLPNISLLLMNR